MRTLRLFKSVPGFLLGVMLGTGLLATAAVYAVDGDPPGLFQLDGDADETTNFLPAPGNSTNGEDWNQLYNDPDGAGPLPGTNDGGTPIAFTGIVPDPAPHSIYWKGGTKDIHDLPGWWHKDGSVPDKDDITNAFAAAYLSPDNGCRDPADHGVIVTCGAGTEGVDWEYVRQVDDLIIYFGFDRYANSGDAFGGFWFFQNDVCDDEVGYEDRFTDCTGTGTLASHVAKAPNPAYPADPDAPEFLPGDLLVLVEYPQGANAVPVIKAYEWDPGDVDGDGNLDSDGGKLGSLDQVFSSEDDLAVSSVCDGLNLKTACAITNDPMDGAGFDIGEIDVDWDYTPKDGTVGSPPPESFFEGGVNVTQLLGSRLCVSTFLAESRASRSEDAILKDYALGDFNVCSVGIRTEIHVGTDHDTNYDANAASGAGGSINPGDVIHDAAYLDLVAPGGFEVTGNVTFELFNNTICDPGLGGSALLETQTVSAASGSLDGDEWRVETPQSYTALGGESYSYLATYDGGDDFDETVAACETVTANKYDSSTLTRIHAGDPSASHGLATADIQFGVGAGEVTATDKIHDWAKVTGVPGVLPTGDVTFELFSGDNCASTSGSSIEQHLVPLGEGTEYGDDTDDEAWVASPVFDTTNFVETYGGEGASFAWLSYKASYGGDGNYKPSAESGCEALKVVKPTPTVATEIHAGVASEAHSSTDIQFGVGDGTIIVGATIHDLGKVTGIAGYTPTGSVTFTFYGDDSCTSAVGANGSTNSLADGPEAGDITNGRKVASDDFDTTGYVPSGASFAWLSYKASYGGDSVYTAATDSACEKLKVEKLVPTVTTNVHAMGRTIDHEFGVTTDIQDTTITIGATVHDVAAVTGSGPKPTGEVVFRFYDDASCTSEIVANASTKNLSSDDTAEDITGGRSVESADFDTTGYVTSGAERALAYKASYGGDGVYVAADDSDCEDLVVQKLTPTVVTEIHSGMRNSGHTFGTGLDIQDTDFTIGGTLHDMAQVTGSGPTPTGNVVFRFYTDDQCTNEVGANSSTHALTGSGVSGVGLAESSDFDTSGYVPDGSTTKVLAYKASYGGDGTYIAADESSCEDLRVVKRLPSIVTNVLVLDLAKVTGDGGPAPTGNVDFEIFSGVGCSGNPVLTEENVSLVQENGDLVARLSSAFQTVFAETGTNSISYRAMYDGDSNYVGVTHDCENVTVTLPGATQGTL